MRRLISFTLSLFLLSLPVFNFSVQMVSAAADRDIYSYLIIGLDDAGENTDVLCIASYNGYENDISVIQIPRDTYYESGFYQNKLNQVYAGERLNGKSEEEALLSLKNAVADVLGIAIEGYVALDAEAFVDFVDGIGGVYVDIPEGYDHISKFQSIGIDLIEGVNLLNGNDALKFVRYRQGYIQGDLARLDTQKLFFDGLFTTLRQYLTKVDVFTLISLNKGLKINLSLPEFAVMIIKHLLKFKEVTFTTLTMPGQAFKHANELWYYIINRPASEQVIERFLWKNKELDEYVKLVNLQDEIAKGIYYDTNITFDIFTHDNSNDAGIA